MATPGPPHPSPTMPKPAQLSRRTIPDEVLDHFAKTSPWAHKILTDPTHIPVAPPYAHFSPSDPDHCLIFRQTLSTPETIPFFEPVYVPPKPNVSPLDASPVARLVASPYGQVLTIIQLGPGINGYPGHAHGGFLGVLFDELCATAAACERRGLSYTANMNVEFRKRVRTDEVLLGRAWVEREEGRKCWVRSRLEEQNGVVLAECTTVWVDVPTGKL
ncbi:hypothetical protein BJ508DRAFT_412219 [Ascobolus immersus RN42]|uniref:Thioesterase domain-containing protein n=1 Tax=Ascobolus immersus RN42 TaxID=1160509 RepID=A0A3N4IK64_ASCIM|nr:hypothetical protein BJ508DRAFT_412219 [Ascobolus immersus RN42]